MERLRTKKKLYKLLRAQIRAVKPEPGLRLKTRTGTGTLRTKNARTRQNEQHKIVLLYIPSKNKF